jgi:type VI secretion system protein ImpG
VDRYYEEELRYLTEAGREFAEKHPERAAFLRLDSKDRDPYVERLLEGFAFLTGRIREKLDDDYPEFTRGLLEILFPHYLRPVPSMALLQFQPRRGAVQQTQRLPRGTSVYSVPVGREGISCRFTTTSDVRLNPITVEEAKLERTAQGRHVIRVKLTVDRGVDPRTLELDPLPIALHGDPTLTATLFLHLTWHLERVRLRETGGQSAIPIDLPDPVRPAGFGDQEALLPYALRSFPAYRCLQEYFAFRERFLAVELHGLGRLPLSASSRGIEVEFHLRGDYPEEKRFAAENFKLHCTPVVNLFSMDLEPVRVNQESVEYTLIPDARYPTSIEVYGVEGVEGSTERLRRPYQPYFAFEHAGATGPREIGTYVVHQRLGATGRWHTALRLNRPAAALVEGKDEALSVHALCTNGQLPRELGEGSLTVPGTDFPEFAHFTNLTRPTPPAYPPQGQELEWRLVSNLALHQASLASAEALRALLQLYDWSGAPANRRRLAGIRRMTLTPEEQVLRGAPVRGAHAAIEVAEDHFVDRADVYLFGLVLSRFLRLYASINSFVRVTVETVPSGDRYEWQPTLGQIATL